MKLKTQFYIALYFFINSFNLVYTQDSNFLNLNNLDSVYALGNKCVRFRNEDGKNLTKYLIGNYYLKPSELGRFILYSPKGMSETYLKNSNKLVAKKEIDKNSIWEILPQSDGKVKLKHVESSAYIKKSGLSTRPKKFTLEITPTTECNKFPEAELNISYYDSINNKTYKEEEVEPFIYKGPENNPDSNVWGAVDTHTHFLSHDVANGRLACGKAFSPFGIKDALGDCRNIHGINGNFELFNLFNEGKFQNYDTKGYPNFKDWPRHDLSFNQTSYYQWLNRARYGGLRLIVSMADSMSGVCKLQNKFKSGGVLGIFQKGEKCNTGTEDILTQIKRVDELINYIDAQHGGIGKGWLQLALNPQDAREIIKQGKMAVIKSVETPDLFGCIKGGTNPGEKCTEEHIESSMNKLYDLGVREGFMAHHYDNEFAGADHFQIGISLFNHANNGHYPVYSKFEEEDIENGTCLKGENGKDLFALVKGGIPTQKIFNVLKFVGLTLFSKLLGGSFPSNLPSIVENDKKYCEKSSITSKGIILMKEFVKKGMILDLAHLTTAGETKAKKIFNEINYPYKDTHKEFTVNDTLKNYSFYSTELTNFNNDLDWMEAIKLNGQISNNMVDGRNLRSSNNLSAYLFSTDTFGTPPLPSNKNQNTPGYPFTLNGIVYHKQKSGNKLFDIKNGTSHMGLFPDMIANQFRMIKLGGGIQEDMDPIFNGAEYYIRAWEKAIEVSNNIKNSPEFDDMFEGLINNEVKKEKKLNENIKALVSNDSNSLVKSNSDNYKLFPSLVKDKLYIENNTNSESFLLSIYDQIGVLVFSEKVNANIENSKIEVNKISELKPGIYFVTINDGKEINKLKFIKK